jgi:hypothetical protein
MVTKEHINGQSTDLASFLVENGLSIPVRITTKFNALM